MRPAIKSDYHDFATIEEHFESSEYFSIRQAAHLLTPSLQYFREETETLDPEYDWSGRKEQIADLLGIAVRKGELAATTSLDARDMIHKYDLIEFAESRGVRLPNGIRKWFEDETKGRILKREALKKEHLSDKRRGRHIKNRHDTVQKKRFLNLVEIFITAYDKQNPSPSPTMFSSDDIVEAVPQIDYVMNESGHPKLRKDARILEEMEPRTQKKWLGSPDFNYSNRIINTPGRRSDHAKDESNTKIRRVIQLLSKDPSALISIEENGS